jgi:hypothetical protein
MLNGGFWPILLKKSDYPKRSNIYGRKHLFCPLLREIRVRKPLSKVKISISGAYFFDAQTMADCFQQNRPEAACRI